MSASVRYQFGNLTSPKVAAHVHGPADPGVDGNAGILFDLDVEQQPTARTVDVPADPVQRQQMVGWIKGGQTYINVHSATYPTGEIKGILRAGERVDRLHQAEGSAAAPARRARSGDDELQRKRRAFSFNRPTGPTEAEVTDAMQLGVNGWLDRQMSRRRRSPL
jgi:hypothetical protein